MASLEMKVVMLLFGFAAALYGFAALVDGGPVYRDSPGSLLAPAQALVGEAVES